MSIDNPNATDGFYRLTDEDTLYYGQADIYGPGFELKRDGHDNLTYPIEGWWWFDTRAEARAALLPASTGKLDAQILQDLRDRVQGSGGDLQQLAQVVTDLLVALGDIAV